MGEQVAARLPKKTTRKSVIYRYGHILVGGEQNEACEQGCVNPYQQGSAVPYNWFLPVIRGFKEV